MKIVDTDPRLALAIIDRDLDKTITYYRELLAKEEEHKVHGWGMRSQEHRVRLEAYVHAQSMVEASKWTVDLEEEQQP